MHLPGLRGSVHSCPGLRAPWSAASGGNHSPRVPRSLPKASSPCDSPAVSATGWPSSFTTLRSAPQSVPLCTCSPRRHLVHSRSVTCGDHPAQCSGCGSPSSLHVLSTACGAASSTGGAVHGCPQLCRVVDDRPSKWVSPRSPGTRTRLLCDLGCFLFRGLGYLKANNLFRRCGACRRQRSS